MAAPEIWRSKLRTARAIILMCWARVLVGFVPLKHWRQSLGLVGGRCSDAEARRLAAHVTHGATFLPLQLKCLPRAMALSWMLRSAGIGHSVVIAVRPPHLRGSEDDLHAWVEVSGQKVIGDLPDPWLETLRVGA